MGMLVAYHECRLIMRVATLPPGRAREWQSDPTHMGMEMGMESDPGTAKERSHMGKEIKSGSE
jgi:hypothetical protein